MSSKMIVGAALAMMSLAFATACTHEGKKKPHAVSLRVPQDHGKSSFTIVEFPKGESALSRDSQSELKDFIQRATNTERYIEDIRVLAWSDRIYTGESKAPPKEIILANDRASNIREYLEKKISNDMEIAAVNMAKHPTPFKDKKISENKASKAIVIIDYQRH